MLKGFATKPQFMQSWKKEMENLNTNTLWQKQKIIPKKKFF